MNQTKPEKKEARAPVKAAQEPTQAPVEPAAPAQEPTEMLCRVTTDRKPAYEGRNLLQNEVLPLPPYMANMLVSRGWAVLVKA